jgi:hypothetical protein
MAKARKPDEAEDEVRALKMLEALYGATLSKEQWRQFADHFNSQHLKQTRERRKLLDASRKLTRPFVDAALKELGTDVAAARKSLHELANKVHAAPLATSPRFKPGLMPGSTIAVFTPPYSTYSASANGGTAEVTDENKGIFHLACQSIGDVHADPLLSLSQAFRPNINAWVHFKAGVQYSYNWWDTAMGYTAHTFGRIGLSLWLQVPGQPTRPQPLAGDTRELWADGVGWGEGHGNPGQGTLSLDIPWYVQSPLVYSVSVWGTIHTDADDGLLGVSAAGADLICTAPLIAIKSG